MEVDEPGEPPPGAPPTVEPSAAAPTPPSAAASSSPAAPIFLPSALAPLEERQRPQGTPLPAMPRLEPQRPQIFGPGRGPIQQVPGPENFPLSPREDAAPLVVPEGLKLTPANVGRTVRDVILSGIKSLPETKHREQHEHLKKLATHLGSSFTMMWDDFRMGAKLTAELLAEEMKQNDTLEAAKEFKLEVEKGLVAFATQIVVNAVNVQDMKEPEGIMRTGSVRNSLGMVARAATALNQHTHWLLKKDRKPHWNTLDLCTKESGTK